LHQVVEEWIVLLHEDGAALPKGTSTAQYSGKFVVRVAPTLHHRLALKAKAAGESLNTFVSKSLMRA
jgi:predicted HicB family RNase H-like nuclease